MRPLHTALFCAFSVLLPTRSTGAELPWPAPSDHAAHESVDQEAEPNPLWFEAHAGLRLWEPGPNVFTGRFEDDWPILGAAPPRGS